MFFSYGLWVGVISDVAFGNDVSLCEMMLPSASDVCLRQIVETLCPVGQKVIFIKMCQSNYTGKFKHTVVSAAITDKKYWRESLYVLAKAETKGGILKGGKQRNED